MTDLPHIDQSKYFKVIIAGSRDFQDYELLKSTMDKLLANRAEPIQIVSGHSRGADTLAEYYAAERGHSLKIFKAFWAEYGIKAGPMRNKQMADYADACVCFWDGESSGTRWMIQMAENKGLPLRVIKYKPINQ